MEKRQSPRFKTTKLKALITLLISPDSAPVEIEGDVLDMSMTGLKIKLHTALPSNLGQAKIKISLTSAHSTIPIHINGVIRYQSLTTQYGLQFAAENTTQAINNLLFECARVSHH